jgi:hypothetical protein
MLLFCIKMILRNQSIIAEHMWETPESGPYTNRFRPDRVPKIIVMNEMTIKVISGVVHA